MLVLGFGVIERVSTVKHYLFLIIFKLCLCFSRLQLKRMFKKDLGKKTENADAQGTKEAKHTTHSICNIVSVLLSPLLWIQSDSIVKEIHSTKKLLCHWKVFTRPTKAEVVMMIMMMMMMINHVHLFSVLTASKHERSGCLCMFIWVTKSQKSNTELLKHNRPTYLMTLGMDVMGFYLSNGVSKQSEAININRAKNILTNYHKLDTYSLVIVRAVENLHYSMFCLHSL